MKTKNQTGHTLLELKLTPAANDDGISPPATRDGSGARGRTTWSPTEVWRTRVRKPALTQRSKPAPL